MISAPQSAQHRHERENLPRAEEHRDFADEIRKARQPAAGHRRHEQRRADERHLPAKPAELAHFQRAGLLVNVAAQRERQRREEAVRDHDEHRAGHADEVQAGDAEENEAHVRHAGIADEQVQILLPHRHPADVQECCRGRARREFVIQLCAACGISGSAMRIKP